MTEAEAKTKWCPQSRLISQVDPRNPIREMDATCIGSNCMMWRWENTLQKCDGNHRSLTACLDKECYLGEERIKPNHGYCGLAGKL